MRKMSRQLVCIIVACIAILPVHALTESVDGITWTYTVANGVASIGGGSSDSPAVRTSTSGAITIPSILCGYPVTSIGNYAFYRCSGLTSVTIPGSVTRIGYGAFSVCDRLTNVTIPDGVTSIGSSAFYACHGLTSVTIPDSVTSIGTSAFGYCNGSLFDTTTISGVQLVDGWAIGTTGTLPEDLNLTGVRGIGDSAFSGCSGLTSVTISDSVTSIGASAFSGCSGLTSVTISESVTSIGDSAFSGCSGLTSVTIPSSVTSIGTVAFHNCSGLTGVTIPNSVTNIGDSAFEGCSVLEEITLPFVGARRGNTGSSDSLFGYIFGTWSYTGGTGTMQYYSSSSYITCYIPSKLRRVVVTDETVLGYGAFCGCSGLTSVTIPDSVTSIEASAFEGCNDSLFDTTTISGVKLVDGWVIGTTGTLSGYLDLTGIRGIGYGAFYGCRKLTSVTIPDGVTGVGSSAFYNCSGLTSVTIPDGVTSVGSSAFYGCSGLTSVTIPDGVTSVGSSAFENCSGLTSVTIPDSVTSIGGYAFCDCSGLTSVTIPDGVTSIGGYAFHGCRGLTSVTIPDSVTKIGKSMFSGCDGLKDVTVPQCVCAGRMSSVFPSAYQSITNVVISDSVTSIVYSAFENCSGLTSVTIPDSVTSIGNRAFAACDSLTNINVHAGNVNFSSANGLLLSWDGTVLFQGVKGDVTIPEGVINIEDYAFYNCSGLTSVTIPDSVTNIGNYAFYNCNGLTSVTIPDGVTSMGESAFYGCRGLMNVVIGNSVTTIGDSAFCGCSGLTGVTIPDGVTSIGGAAFYGCSGLTSVLIGNGVTSIGAFAFYNCSGLTSMTIPNGVTSIEGYTFSGCSSLERVILPDSVMSIGVSAFDGCSKLREVAIPQCASSSRISSVFPSAYGTISSVVVNGNVEILSEGFFDGCVSLTNVIFLSEDTSLGDNDLRQVGHLFDLQPDGYWVAQKSLVGFKGACPSTVPDVNNLVRVMDGALEGCTSLTDLTFTAESVLTNIGANAFKGCTELQTLVLPPSLEEIGDEAFMGCSYIDNVIVPGSVKSVGARAFKNCTGFTAAQIEHGVESLGDEAFYGDWRIAEVDIPSTVTNIGVNAFGGDSSIIRVGLRGDIRPLSGIFSNYGLIREATVKAGDGPIMDGLFKSCSQLLDVRFFGNCPGLANNGVNIYNGTKSGLTTYVEQGSTGWDGTPGSHALPQSWPLSGSYRRAIAWWNEPTYLVLFDSNGGTLGVQDTYQRSERPFAMPPEPVQTGYTFAGWWTKPSGGLRVTAETVFIEGVYTRLYAHWTKGHWVFLDPNGGTVTNELVTYVDQTVYGVLPAAVRTGYAFGGWRYEGRTILPATPIATPADHTLTAQWEAYRYGIRFDANGGTGEMADLAMVYDEAKPLASNIFTRAGYEFGGWATSGGENAVAAFAEGEIVENLSAEENGMVTLFATWNRLTVAEPIVTPGDGTVFMEGSCEVSITCATEGATIYYTTNGVSPRLTDRFRYDGPFMIAHTATVKAVAVLDGVKSGYATSTISKRLLTLGEAASADATGGALNWTTGGDAQWNPVVDTTSSTGFSAQSGAIGEAAGSELAATWLQSVVTGAGTFSFRWKVDCEWDDSGDMTWDHVAVFTNGVEAVRMDGTSGWEDVSFVFADAGTHTIRWTFVKDDYDEEDADYADCAWVSGVTWIPAGGSGDTVVDMGGGKSVTVPGDWLTNITERIESAGGDVAAALQSTAANGRMSVAECYVLGVDPEVAAADFKITSITIGADGKPVVEFEPPQAKWNVPGARAVLKGAERLEGPWGEVGSAGGESAYRFFKVEVVLP